MERALLTADIGGTHARFLLVAAQAVELPADAACLELNTRDHKSPDDLLETALTRLKLRAAECDAAFAVAGPVRQGQVHLTNLGWDLSESALQRQPGFRRARLLNDLAAAAWTLAEHPPRQSRALREAAVAADGRHAVVSVSTGLGIAYWTRSGEAPRVEPSEGGHVGFTPSDSWETDYLRTLQEHHGGRISWERVLCGAGLAALEAYLRGGGELAPAEVARRAAAGNATAVKAVQRFSRLLGVFVGDRVLAAPITGSIWLMGGVLAGLGEQLDQERFLDGLDAKGRISPELTRRPVRVTRDDFLGLHGAYYAARAGRG